LSDNDFAYVKKEGAYKTRRYPMRKQAHVQASIMFFADHYGDHSPGEQFTISRRLLKRADDLQVKEDEIPEAMETLRKMAECSYSPDLFAHVQVRKSMVDSESARTLDTLWEKRASFDAESFATLLSKFDEISGLNSYYGKGLPDPVNSAVSIEKTAAQVEYMNGTRHIGHDILKSIDNTKIAAIFGEDLGKKWGEDPISAFEGMSDSGKDLVVDNIVRGAIS